MTDLWQAEYAERSAHFDALVQAEQVRRQNLAKERATALLLDHLTEEQRGHYRAHGYFDVIGRESGKRYRLWHRTMQNIEELDASGQRACVWCVHPVGIPMADVLLAQKLALELFELEALLIARRHSGFTASSLCDNPWYELRVIEPSWGDTEFTCKRCRHSLVITPRFGEQAPSTCPACGFHGRG